MSKLAFSILVATGTALTTAVANSQSVTTDPKTNATSDASKPVAKYELVNKSAFNLPQNSRPPFWPIGWVKRAPGAAVPIPTKRQDIRPEMFPVTSILIQAGAPSLAVIAGRSYEEGQFLRIRGSELDKKIRVARITDGKVILQYEDQVITVPQRRDFIDTGEKKETPELLLDSDR